MTTMDAKWAQLLDSIERHEGFIKHEATAIEKEVANAVKQHLIQAFPGFTLLSPTNFPRYFNDPIKSGEVITELDGVYILSSDPEIKAENVEFTVKVPIAPDLRHELGARAKTMRELAKGLSVMSHRISDGEINRLVIIEAKHHVTRDKIHAKLEQMERMSQYLEWAKNPPVGTLLKFKKNVETFGFDKYSSRVQLYVGGVCWEDDAVDYVQKLLAEGKGEIGIVWPSGNRYDVYDVSNGFGKAVKASSSGGGRKKKSGGK